MGSTNYDAFGREVRSTGPASNTMAFRFSTKATDVDTGLVYYGYRFYDPDRGRWPNRDPYGEAGGANIYAFLSNETLNSVDLLGLHRVDGKGNPCCSCALARIQLHQLKEWARQANRAQPEWSWNFQCAEQAGALCDGIMAMPYFSCISVRIVGGMTLGVYTPLFPIGGNQHHVMLVTADVGGQDRECSGFPKVLILDGYHEKDMNTEREVTQQTPEAFRNKYPVEDPKTPSPIVYPPPPPQPSLPVQILLGITRMFLQPLGT